MASMTLVLSAWALAMWSGIAWAWRYTAGLTAATLAAFLWAHGAALTGWPGWLVVVTLGMTPCLLAAQRAREARARGRWHAEEAACAARLSDTARELLQVQREAQQMDRQIAQMTDLYHVTKETTRALRLEELFSASLEIAPRLLKARGLRLIDLSAQPPRVLRAVRAPDGRMAATGAGAANGAAQMEQTIIRAVMSSGQPASGTAQELSCPFPEGLSRVAWAPLWREQQPIGVLVADELPASQLDTLAIVANQLSLQCTRIHFYQQVEALAVTDALTGLFVRRYFLERSQEELSRSRRHGASCTVLMADLDHFKQINDTYGHLVGDVVLQEVARLLLGNLREVDLVARYGGEEFILLLIESDAAQALPIAERLRQMVEVHPVRAYDEVVSPTISIGMAAFPAHGQTLELLIERADQALYTAKRDGRNQVVVWPG
jgi:diguanylate cyclase (GGDEF)-like protein